MFSLSPTAIGTLLRHQFLNSIGGNSAACPHNTQNLRGAVLGIHRLAFPKPVGGAADTGIDLRLAGGYGIQTQGPDRARRGTEQTAFEWRSAFKELPVAALSLHGGEMVNHGID